MARDKILVKGARVHNLKNIDVEIPRDKFVVVTGLSGSGKSSLAFDTIYAEGQRRYVESLSAYARQFLGQMDKPDVEYIEGLSPAISIDQKTTSRNPRSTVGTVTEVYDYLRLLYARIGKPHCPNCGQPVVQQTLDQMVDKVMSYPEQSKLQLLAPLIRGRKGEHVKVLEDARKQGYVRVRVDGEVRDLSEDIVLEKNKKHTIEVVVDRIVLKADSQQRVADSLETALRLGEGLVVVDMIGQEELLFSQHYACTDCGISMSELAPRNFSFNAPYGACSDCTGLGFKMEIDPDLVVPDQSKTLRGGAIATWNVATSTWLLKMLEGMGKTLGFSVDEPFANISKENKRIILFGAGERTFPWTHVAKNGRTHAFDSKWEGVIPALERRYRETTSESQREDYEKYMSTRPCPACKGKRLKPEVLAVTIGDKNIAEVTDMSIEDALSFFNSLELTEREQKIARQVMKEIRERLGFLVNVGLDYLTMSRAAGTLSGGEAQRIRLATQIGSSLVGVLYILDEPSIGLHQRDNDRLLATLKHLRDLGNTLIVVEHDEDTMFAADHIIDIGPGAGVHGGEIIAQGDIDAIMASEASITGQYLSGKKRIHVPKERRSLGDKYIEIVGAKENNLKNVSVKFPLGVFTCVTGVSGSGKSTLVNEILYKSLAHHLYRAKDRPGQHKEIRGLEHIDKVIDIDQSPIGRTPRSNPATYTGVFDAIRELFSSTPEAKVRGYMPGRFSFNVKGGRCEACKGDGIIKIEMHFLPDVYVPCEVCKGKRYNRETLEVKYKGKTIADVLNMNVEEALEFFANIPKIKRKIQTLADVGLGYVKLGQPATTLSGGEAQRVKLATELSRRSTGRTVYILDEPTTGLHIADIDKLLTVLQRLADNGDTVIVIEHNLDVIKTADHIIDLGPEGGAKGGKILATCTPEELCENKKSYTGVFLKKQLERDASVTRKQAEAVAR